MNAYHPNSDVRLKEDIAQSGLFFFDHLYRPTEKNTERRDLSRKKFLHVM